MSDTRIKDGTGSCRTAKVDESNRLAVRGDVTHAFESAMLNERAFAIVSVDVTLTDDNESGILYLYNDDPSNLIIDHIVIGVGQSTDGVGLAKSITYSGPTGGTLLTEETDAIVVNLAAGSSIQLNANAYVGGQGKTVVGTGLPSSLFVSAPDYDTSLPKTVMARGDSSAISIIPPTGNTSMVITVSLYVYLQDYV